MAPTRLPSATYRLQFHNGFGFSDALKIVPYLHDLGISHVYASPLFKARPGSQHGYDVVDPTQLNPELGSREEFEDLVSGLHERGMGLILDIVPNHMAVDSANPWWMDLLEFGRFSPYADFFDIRWIPDERCGEILLVPVLASPLEDCLRQGALRLTLEEVDLDVPGAGEAGARVGSAGPSGRRGLAFFIRYYDQRFPVHAGSWLKVLGFDIQGTGDGEAVPLLRPLVAQLTKMGGFPTLDSDGRGWRLAAGTAKVALAGLADAEPGVRSYVESRLAAANAQGSERNVELIRQVLEGAPYRLAHARVTAEQYVYRRFFDINSLIGVRVEGEPVFQATHELVFKLSDAGFVDGLRVDHVDGLRDPESYLAQLQTRVAGGSTDGAGWGPLEAQLGDRTGTGSDIRYAIVEKILAPGEFLRDCWPVSGTTGYDFLNEVGHLFIDVPGLRLVERHHARITGQETDFKDLAYAAKKRVLHKLFGGELLQLVGQLATLLPPGGWADVFSQEDLAEAFAEITCCLPVYRTYVRHLQPGEADRRLVWAATAEAERRTPALASHVLHYLRGLLSLDPAHPAVAANPQAALELVLRWQQLTGPVAAKGVEDTALYRDARLIALDEVGSDTLVQAAVVERFHNRNHYTRERWPGTLSTTSTHDTKRSEDVRARLDVLSEVAGDWAKRLERWMVLNSAKRASLDGHPVPDVREEILIYQTLVGAWPLKEAEVPEFVERVKRYATKALREAKIHSDWRAPEVNYEQLVAGFIDGILGAGENRFVEDLRDFVRSIAWWGALNSLGQLLAKVVCPGVPDFYQGNEIWDFSLADPDNRRAVDFSLRERLLAEIKQQGSVRSADICGDLLANWQDGRIKLFVTRRALAFRRANWRLFHEGEYVALEVEGPSRDHLVGIARRWRDQWALALIPRLMSAGDPSALGAIGHGFWTGTHITLPLQAPGRWQDVFAGRTVLASAGSAKPTSLPACDVLAELPVALLCGGSARCGSPSDR